MVDKLQEARLRREAIEEQKAAQASTFDSDRLARAIAKREAAEQAGLTPQESPLSYGQMFTMALANTPKSSAQFVEDTLAPVLSPLETVNSLFTLGKGLVQLAIPGEQADEKTAEAVGTYFAKRYGGVENFKRAFADDPVGILGDVSMVVTGGGALAAKAPGIIGKAGQAAVGFGQAIDPLNLGIKAAGATGRLAAQAVPAIAGMTTGAGGESIQQAFNAGREGGEQQERFLANMRGEEDLNAVVEDAMAAMRTLRQDRGTRFEQGRNALELEKMPVNMDAVAQAYADFAESFKYEGVSELSPKAQMKMVEISKIISNWQGSPGLHTAKGLDILKRRIDAAYPEGINPGDSAMVASRARDIVYKEITTQVPDYRSVMQPYEEAIRLEKEMQKALSLGKNSSADTILRKLQSVMRNNVNANFGQRLSLVEKLESAGDYFLLPRLAGQSLNNIAPRGLQGAAATGAGVSGVLNPANLAALPFMSPRIMGEAANAAGRATGQMQPAMDAVAAPLNYAQRALAPYQSQIQGAAMGSRMTGQTVRASEEDQLTPQQRAMLGL